MPDRRSAMLAAANAPAQPMRPQRTAAGNASSKPERGAEPLTVLRVIGVTQPSESPRVSAASTYAPSAPRLGSMPSSTGLLGKPAGINTVRHPAELEWKLVRRGLSPTLEDRLREAITARLGQSARSLPALRKVHRLDKLTSGLVVFARSHLGERVLGGQFGPANAEFVVSAVAFLHFTVAAGAAVYWCLWFLPGGPSQ